jgi:hypothetical protein
VYFEQGGELQRKGRLVEEDSRIVVKTSVRAMGFVQIGYDPIVNREVLRDDQSRIAVAVPQHYVHLGVGEVLQNLPQEGELTVRQLVFGQVPVLEAHLGTTELHLVVLDERTHDVDADVVEVRADQPTAHAKVTTTEVNHDPDASFGDEVPDERYVGARHLVGRAVPRIELPITAPELIGVNLLECLPR